MKVAMILTSLLFLSATAYGAEIQGRVLNVQGATVAGAKVTVTHQQEGARWEATTGADGTYSVAGLEPGIYTVTVSGPSGLGTLRREVAVGEGSSPAQADFQFTQAAGQALSAAEERNPNIFVYRIDLNDLRNRLNVGRGPDPQYVPEFLPEQNYFGAEFGAPLLRFEGLRPRALATSWRGSIFGLHQNSALNARNFFNVGPLRPSRVSNYALTAGGPLRAEKASLLLEFGQSFTSGMVNGNIQAPLPLQLTPRSPNPQINAVIGNLLRAYPAEFPNLRLPNGHTQLNSNAPRDIDATDGLARLDLQPRDNTSFAFRYSINDYSEDPFQLVAGQNPQTDLRSQAAYTSVTRTFSPATVGRLGFHYDRATALLEPTHRFSDLFASLGIAAVPDIDFTSDVITDIGPGLQFPRHRVQNRFQLYSDFSRVIGQHTLKAGGSSTRVQVNDLQSDNSRGSLRFSADFGRTEIENFLLGTPNLFTITLGNLYRGFRNWEHSLFFEDQIRLHPTFSLSVGLRYELFTAPTEVNHLTEVGFPTDKNNLAPRFGFAWNPGRGKTTVRGSYGISYGTIFPVTYGMTRFNSPATQTLQIAAPDLLNPLAGFSPQPTQGGRSSVWRLSPDLVLPYSHQYTLGIERTMPWASTWRLAYIGMRTIHLLSHQIYNRALPDPRPICNVPDPNRPCNTTGDINQRRADPRYFAINMIESNSIAYYDAVQLSVDKRLTHGLTVRAAYTFGKNIDTGGDFTNTASGVDKPPEGGEATSELVSRVADMKGLSLFDTTHAFIISYSYNLPFPGKTNGWTAALLRGWQISGTTLFQSGTPFHAHTGSDAPGFGNVDGETHDRPDILNPSILGKSLDNPDTSWLIWRREYFDPNLAPGGRGNIGMNTFRKDGTNNWNLAVGRTFRFPGGRERSLQFRTEFFNFLNHAQFEKPGVLYTSPVFGQITNTANKGRQVQFSLRLNF